MSTYVQHMDHAIILDEVSFPFFQANLDDSVAEGEQRREREEKRRGRGETRARKAAAADTRREKQSDST